MRESIYNNSHAPCEHFARIGYDLIASGIDCKAMPEDEYEDDHPGSQSHWLDQAVLTVLRDFPEPSKKRKKDEAELIEETGKKVWYARQEIDWHRYLPELKTFAGQSTIETTIHARATACRGDDLPFGTRLIDWQLPLSTCSGLDARVAPNALDDGFSVSDLKMDIISNVACELLAIVGMQVATIIRYGRKHYGYVDPDGQWWEYRIVQRVGKHRVTTMATQRLQVEEN